MKKIIPFLYFSFFLSGFSYAITTWVGSATITIAAWNDPINWSPAGVPLLMENVIFNMPVSISENVPITASNNVRIESTGSLTIDGGVTLEMNNVVVDGGTWINNGDVTANNVTYGVVDNGVITNNGTMNLNNLNVGQNSHPGTFDNNGDVTVIKDIVVEEGILDSNLGGTVFSIGLVVRDGGNIINGGTMTSQGTSMTTQTNVNLGGTFINEASGTLHLDLSKSNVRAIVVQGDFDNQGTINVGLDPTNPGSHGVRIGLDANFTNTGVMTFNIDPANCVLEDNHGMDGSFSTDPVFIISGMNCLDFILPLELIDFTAVNRGTYAMLNWLTANEVNTASFFIEHSTDGVEFTTIGSVLASGNTNTTTSYTYKNHTPANADNYYRLKMIDLDESYTYSPIRTLVFRMTNALVLYPNPMQDQVNLNHAEIGATFYILSMDGRLMASQTCHDTELQLNIGNLPSGVYILQQIKDGEVLSRTELAKE